LGPDYRVTRCFGCEDTISVDARKFNTITELNLFFIKEIDNYKKHFIHSECLNCQFYLGGNCFGGCFANYSSKLVDIKNSKKLDYTYIIISDKEIIYRAVNLFQKRCKNDFVNYIKKNLSTIQNMKKYQSFYILAEYYNAIGNRIRAISLLRSCLRICPETKREKFKAFLYHIKKRK
jgi:radical SAM protein with 4Fe4S-binding SPASM domain